jgi:hypothetical protein
MASIRQRRSDEKMKEGDHLEDTSTDGRTLKLGLKESDGMA